MINDNDQKKSGEKASCRPTASSTSGWWRPYASPSLLGSATNSLFPYFIFLNKLFGKQERGPLRPPGRVPPLRHRGGLLPSLGGVAVPVLLRGREAQIHQRRRYKKIF